MNMIWAKSWRRRDRSVSLGCALYDWALPVHITVVQPYTSYLSGKWMLSITITVLCFYLEVEV